MPPQISDYPLAGPIWFIGIGVILMLIAFSHYYPLFNKLDQTIFRFFYNLTESFKTGFVFLWPLGTTPVAVLLISMTFIPGIWIGISTASAYITVAIVEYIIKKWIHRTRPFIDLEGVNISQPIRPTDSSFPSGDTLRVWYLAITIPQAFGLGMPAQLISCLLAGTISMGRIALGVHYPLDVLGGIGLALTGAGLFNTSIRLSLLIH